MGLEAVYGRSARTSFHVWDENRPEGCLSGSQEWIGLRGSLPRAAWRYGPPFIHVFHEQAVTPSPLTETACITCNTYSPAYKGKDLKKRLSPKSLNTLIHSYVTFYIFLIFQYLSLWKSVFSCN